MSKNASTEAARPVAGRVLLVHLDPEIGSPLRSRVAAGDTVFEERDGHEEAIARLEGAEPVDAVVLGPRLDQPIQTAQRAHVVDPDVTVLILTEPARLSPIAHALELAPFLGGAVRCRAIGDPAADAEALLGDIADAVAHTRRQRSLRTAVAAANGRMAAPVTLDPQAARLLGHLLDHLPVGRALDGVSVLVVDDEPDTRELLTVVLRHYGATVTAVESARGALESLERARPDVLVSDIGMPGEDGYTLIRRIRAMEPEGRPIPAIALTAYARTEERAHALRAGYQRHVAKPVEPLELASVIASLAGRAAPV